MKSFIVLPWKRILRRDIPDDCHPKMLRRGQQNTFFWHFGVPKVASRPELRIVFDAAAKSGGKCLNDFITCGPALQNPLPAVLIGFREGDIGW
jgi:hypothetical protein